jgi:hypothetical protein
LGIFFALWAKIGIFLKILNFDFCQFAQPLNPTLPEFPSVNVYRDKFTEIGKNGFLEISREKREKLLAVGFEFFQ